jgi:hypothetical protein
MNNVLIDGVPIADMIAVYNQRMTARENRKSYMRSYMRTYYANHPEAQKAKNDKANAKTLGYTVEEYLAKKESGEIKRGRPRKVPEQPEEEKK